jgi:uncharacterized glyoxalase superfamily protein PhnB
MSLGTGVIMLGSARAAASVPEPDDALAVRRGIYVAVDGADAHYERAKAAGAEITLELEDTEYGSREYSARDLEGYHWSFGRYRPGRLTRRPAYGPALRATSAPGLAGAAAERRSNFQSTI